MGIKGAGKSGLRTKFGVKDKVPENHCPRHVEMQVVVKLWGNLTHTFDFGPGNLCKIVVLIVVPNVEEDFV